MPNLLLSAVEYTGYISIIKFIVFLLLFFLWLPVISWIYKDAESIGAKQTLWAGIVFGTGAAAAIIWLLIPLFIIGMLAYLVAVAATTLSYLMHRDTRVPEFQKVLTADHIKGLFSNEQKPTTMKSPCPSPKHPTSSAIKPLTMSLTMPFGKGQVTLSSRRPRKTITQPIMSMEQR
ncbi:MAG: hypothetical protein ACYSYT_07255 [Planctomycetota bacterium]